MMLLWMCKVTQKDRKTSVKLRLHGVNIRNCIQRGRWFGHVKKMDKDSWVKKLGKEIVVEGHRERGRSQKTWDEVIQGKCWIYSIMWHRPK